MKKYEKEVAQAQLNNEKEVLKKLENNYKDALEEINSKIAQLMGRADADMQHVVYQVEFQKALRTQIKSILESLQTNEFETVSDYLTKCYDEGFLGTMYSLQSQGVPLVIPINQEEVVAAIQHETNLSTSLYDAFDIKDLQKEISSEISRGFSTGALFSEVARNIASYGKISKNKAMRIARTEGHRITETAAYHAQQKAKDRGADIVKIWDASLDARTRSSHVRVDGEIKELDEKFSNGLKYPGDPNGSAAEVINCRCRSRSDARWALDAEATKMLGNVSEMSDKRKQEVADKLRIPVEDLSLYSEQIVPVKAKSYADFKKQYNQLWRYEGSELQKEAEARIAGYKNNDVDSLIQFMPAKNIGEAQDFAKNVLKMKEASAYEYDLNIDVANGVNKALAEVNDLFGDVIKAGYLKDIVVNTGFGKIYSGYDRRHKELILSSECTKANAIELMGKNAQAYFEAGLWATKNPFHAIYHEVGHMVRLMISDTSPEKMSKIERLYQESYSLILGKDTVWSSLNEEVFLNGGKLAKNNGFSYYGLKDSNEFVSESVAQYFLTDNPSEISRQVVRILTGGS